MAAPSRGFAKRSVWKGNFAATERVSCLCLIPPLFPRSPATVEPFKPFTAIFALSFATRRRRRI
jgi:hypothetical protein